MAERTRKREPELGRAGTRAHSWLAWVLATLSAVLFVASFPLLFLARAAPIPESWDANLSVAGQLSSSFMLVFSVVGVLIASRQPRNPIGWIFLADGLLWNFLGFTDYYGIYGVASPGSVPFPVLVAGFNNFLWVPAVGLLGTYALMLFPDGKLPSKRWRPLAWLTGVALVSISLLVAISPAPLQSLGETPNPFALDLPPWAEGATAIFLVLPLCMLASAASLVVRYRHAVGEQRQQIKWIAFAAVIVVLMYLAAMVSSLVFPSWAWFSAGSPWWMDLLAYAALASFVTIPIAVGFAVLKYRLYDIDLVINRALVYAPLSATLAGAYFGSVVVLQSLLRALTAGESQLAIVASTLAIAALFDPLRRRMQAFVDRRFYRRKYDAAKTLEAFSARLREETDLGLLSEHLVGVVGETMRPTHISLWLATEAAPEGDQPEHP